MSTGQANQPEPSIAKPSKSVLETLINHPIGFWFIFWGELAERCSFYGMMAILPRFISEENGLFLGDANSNTWVSAFKAAAYLLPLLGGFLADQYLGKYRLIVLFSIPYILGHVLMAYETVTWTILALSLLAMGSGIIKPNISTLMGMTYDQKRPGDEGLRSMAFGMFYMAINIGAMISYAVLPVVRDRYGYSIAFLCPAVLMAISFLIFAAGKPFYAVEKIQRRAATPEERALKWLTMRRIAGIFLLITVFWAIFDQSHTIWIFFARDFTDLNIFGWEISVEQIGTLNPLLIVAFVPMMPFLWNFVERRGYRVRPTDKIMLGFLLTALSMGVMAIGGYMCDTYEDKEATRTEKAVTKVEFEKPSKVTIIVTKGKKDEKKDGKNQTEPIVVRADQVTVAVIGEKETKSMKRFVAPRFETDVRGPLQKACARCHGDDGTKDGNLEVGTLAALLKGGVSGPAIKSGKADESLLFTAHKNLVSPDEKDWLSKDQIEGMKKWVNKGATSIRDRKVTIWFEVLAFVLLTLAEVLISITGLELAFVVAPPTMKSFVTALWLLTVAIANFFINAPVGRLYNTMTPGDYFVMLAIATLVVMAVFYFVAQRFNQLAQEQEAAQKKAALSSAGETAPPPTMGGTPSTGIQDKTRTDGITDPDKK